MFTIPRQTRSGSEICKRSSLSPLSLLHHNTLIPPEFLQAVLLHQLLTLLLLKANVNPLIAHLNTQEVFYLFLYSPRFLCF